MADSEAAAARLALMEEVIALSLGVLIERSDERSDVRPVLRRRSARGGGSSWEEERLGGKRCGCCHEENKGALPVDQPSVRGQRSIGTRSNRQIYEMTRKCVIECAPRNLPAMHE